MCVGHPLKSRNSLIEETSVPTVSGNHPPVSCSKQGRRPRAFSNKHIFELSRFGCGRDKYLPFFNIRLPVQKQEIFLCGRGGELHACHHFFINVSSAILIRIALDQ